MNRCVLDITSQPPGTIEPGLRSRQWPQVVGQASSLPVVAEQRRKLFSQAFTAPGRLEEDKPQRDFWLVEDYQAASMSGKTPRVKPPARWDVSR